MSLHVVRLGSPRSADEGLRIGTVRRPPRGVAKERFAADDWYDVWLPDLAPSAELVAEARSALAGSDPDARAWAAFLRKYRREMDAPGAARLLDLLAALSQRTDLSVGCYCEDEAWCHRSALREILAARGARMAPLPAGHRESPGEE
jgi:uncharacterized protein YeaO (DUF488 family)